MIRVEAALVLAAMAYLAIAIEAGPQRENPAQVFDVASIKPLADGDSILPPLRVTPGGGLRGRATLEHMLRFAYDLDLHQKVVAARPDALLLSQRFEIAAQPPTGSSIRPREATLAMLQYLLAERFQLRLRTGTTMETVEVLRQIKPNVLGPGLRQFDGQCGDLPPGNHLSDPQFDGLYKTGCSVTITLSGRVRGTTASMATFARLLALFARRPIVDGTGLIGRFQVEMTFAPDSLRPTIQAMSDAPSFADALRSDLGLKLSVERQPTRALFIEHIGALVEN